jgi:His/Glu/Gln/Arg/opine family amino acid ABC transporter permease subunit
MNIWQDFYNSIIYDNRYLYILEGIKNTVIIAILAVILGIIIGSIITLITNYHKETGKLPILNFIGNLYVTVIRGTPTLLQLMIIYYVIFGSVSVNIILVGSLAFGINSGAYVSEIMRAGIESIDKGQKEAGYAIGLSYAQVMKEIILPQAIKNILPALGNEFITLLKETSVGSCIGIVELTKAGDIIASRTYNYFFPLFIIAIIYLMLTLGLARLLKLVERKLK